MTTIKNRYDFVFLFDVKDGNPNGDPDFDNMPRTDEETNHSINFFTMNMFADEMNCTDFDKLTDNLNKKVFDNEKNDTQGNIIVSKTLDGTIFDYKKKKGKK